MLASESRCSFCYAERPSEQARWLRAEAVEYLRRNRNREHIHVGPRSKFRSMARTLQEMRVLRFESYRPGSQVVTYSWAPYGKALLQEL